MPQKAREEGTAPRRPQASGWSHRARPVSGRVSAATKPTRRSRRRPMLVTERDDRQADLRCGSGGAHQWMRRANTWDLDSAYENSGPAARVKGLRLRLAGHALALAAFRLGPDMTASSTPEVQRERPLEDHGGRWPPTLGASSIGHHRTMQERFQRLRTRHVLNGVVGLWFVLGSGHDDTMHPDRRLVNSWLLFGALAGWPRAPRAAATPIRPADLLRRRQHQRPARSR